MVHGKCTVVRRNAYMWMRVECPLPLLETMVIVDYIRSDIYTNTVICGVHALLIPVCTSPILTLPLKGEQAPYQLHIYDALDIAALSLIHL